MKNTVKLITALIVCAGTSVICQAADKPMQGMDHMKGMSGMGNMQGMGGGMKGMGGGMHGSGMGGMGGMGEMSPEEMDKKMRSMQDHMLKMHDLSNQILSEKNLQKKLALKDKQLDLMKKHMEKMKKMKKMQMMHQNNNNGK